MSGDDAMSDSELANLDIDALQTTNTNGNTINTTSQPPSAQKPSRTNSNAAPSRSHSTANPAQKQQQADDVAAEPEPEPEPEANEEPEVTNNVSDLAQIGEDEAESENDDDDTTTSPTQPPNTDQATTNKRKRLKRAGDINGKVVGSADQFFDDDEYDSEDDDIENFIVDDTNGAHRDRDRRASASAGGGGHVQLQPAFQSTATTYVQKRRYMCWNTTGNIVCRDEDIYQSIEVTFSDSTVNRPVRIRDYYNFAYGALGEHGAVFASHSHIGTQQKLENSDEIDQNRNGVIFYRPFDSWAVNSEWTYMMMTGEEPVCVAIGKRYCAVATTSKHAIANIRIFGYSGIQRAVLALSGPVVTMSGCGDRLAVVYHKAAPLNGNQQLQCVVYDMKSSDVQQSSRKYHCTVVYDGSLPLSPGSQLHWLDFSNKAMLLAYDTAGVVRGLSAAWSQQWMPLLHVDTVKKHKTDFYWPIGCIDDKLMYVQCKQTSKQPTTVPKPTLQPCTLQLPLLSLQTDPVAVMEEQFIRYDMLMCQDWSSMTNGERIKQQATQDKVLLQLINRALTGTSTREVRALDLGALVQLHKSLQVAIQIATKAGKTNVASRLGLLAESKFNGGDAAQNDETATDKYSIEAFMELEKQKDAARQKRLSKANENGGERRVSMSGEGGVYNDSDGEAEMPAAKRGRLRKVSMGDGGGAEKLPVRKNQPVVEKENRTFADINTNIIDTNVNSKGKQGKLFASSTPASEYKPVSKVAAPMNPFAKKS